MSFKVLVTTCAMFGCAAPSPPVAAPAAVSRPAEVGRDSGGLDVGVSEPAATAASPPAPAASGASDEAWCERAVTKFEELVRKRVKTCYFDAVSKNPKLDGRVEFRLDVGNEGEAKAVKLLGADRYGKRAEACMLEAMGSETFREPACATKTLRFEMLFGRAAR